MARYQIYAYDAAGLVVHAGTRDTNRTVTASTVRRWEAAWRKWRREYLAQNDHACPLRDEYRNVVNVEVYPVEHPESVQWYQECK